jgi:hypothetical protein
MSSVLPTRPSIMRMRTGVRSPVGAVGAVGTVGTVGAVGAVGAVGTVGTEPVGSEEVMSRARGGSDACSATRHDSIRSLSGGRRRVVDVHRTWWEAMSRSGT